ncbi:ABC transporter substrate-binding protein [Rugosimonospora acidiphila]|uniref:Thiamine pyrimidine synthase n=1 Tax=Rugosimonospora acidiphila TaxID=556531 RepID=A0ABP9RTB5_9ACTN
MSGYELRGYTDRRTGAGARRVRGPRVRNLAMLSAVLLSGGLSTGCGSSDDPPAAVRALNVVIPTTSIEAEHGIWAAQDRGYFKAEGVAVKVTSVSGGAQAVQSLAAGSAELIDAPTTSVIGSVAKQPSFKPTYVCRTYWAPPLNVYVPADSTVQAGADLKGATIGVDDPDGPAAAAAVALAKSAGLTPTDYKILQVGNGGQALAAFQRKDITAYAGGVGDMAVAQAKGFQVRQIQGARGGVTAGQGFWASAKALSSKSDAITRFLRAYQKGVNYIGTDAGKLAALTKKLAPDQATDNNVTMRVSQAFITMRTHDLPATMASCATTPDDLTTWHDQLNKSGAYSGSQTDFNGYFTDEFAK